MRTSVFLVTSRNLYEGEMFFLRPEKDLGFLLTFPVNFPFDIDWILFCKKRKMSEINLDVLNYCKLIAFNYLSTLVD